MQPSFWQVFFPSNFCTRNLLVLYHIKGGRRSQGIYLGFIFVHHKNLLFKQACIALFLFTVHMNTTTVDNQGFVMKLLLKFDISTS